MGAHFSQTFRIITSCTAFFFSSVLSSFPAPPPALTAFLTPPSPSPRDYAHCPRDCAFLTGATSYLSSGLVCVFACVNAADDNLSPSVDSVEASLGSSPGCIHANSFVLFAGRGDVQLESTRVCWGVCSGERALFGAHALSVSSSDSIKESCCIFSPCRPFL